MLIQSFSEKIIPRKDITLFKRKKPHPVPSLDYRKNTLLQTNPMHIASQNPPSIKACQTYTGELVQMPEHWPTFCPLSSEGKTTQMTTFVFSESRASCYEFNFRLVFANHHTPEEIIKGQSRSYIKKKKIDILFWLMLFVVQTSKQCSAFQDNDTKRLWNNQGLWQILDWLITNSQTHSVQTTSVKICLPQCWIKIPASVCTSGFKSHIESEMWAALKSLSHPVA